MEALRRILGNLGVGAALLLFAAGCGVGGAGPVGIEVQLPERTQYEQFWQQCIEAVRQFGFALDRVDPRAGVILTQPLTSKQWFEFWRRDVTGGSELLEASLHTVRRRTLVNVQSGEGPGEFRVSVTVWVQRQSRPERQITTASTALQAFGTKLPTASGQLRRGETQIDWIDMGRDAKLEAAILAEILRRWPGAEPIVPAADTRPAATQASAGTTRGG